MPELQGQGGQCSDHAQQHGFGSIMPPAC